MIFVVTEDWYFYSHRIPMIKAAKECGFDVSVITNTDQHQSAISDLGVKVIDFDFERRSLNPFKALSQILRLSKIYRREQPDLVHHIAMKPILFGSLAAWLARVPHIVNAFAGLGYVFHDRSLKAKLLFHMLYIPFFLLLRRSNSHTLFQNRNDLDELSALHLCRPDRTHLIRGSGVDIDHYIKTDLPEADPDLICVFAGRMIELKGLSTLKGAFELLHKQGAHIQLHLYGQPDQHNPGSWDLQALKEWDAQSDNVHYKAQADDMALIWQGAHIALQASNGGEGVPKSLLEAASTGRPIIASDVAGCRDIVKDNGFLVPPGDPQAWAQALLRMEKDKEALKQMGDKGRELVEREFSAQIVQQHTAQLYKNIISL